MNLSRLVVLGILANRGPRHGHQIRRDAEMTHVDTWGGVSIGALYRELRLMEGEGLVEAVCTEQVGRRPARTVYRITEEGGRELHVLREQAISDLRTGPDALSVALLFGGAGDRAELLSYLRSRRQALASIREGIATKREYLQGRGYLGPVDVAVFRRGELRLEAELRWHDEFERILTELPDTPPAAPGPGRPQEG